MSILAAGLGANRLENGNNVTSFRTGPEWSRRRRILAGLFRRAIAMTQAGHILVAAADRNYAIKALTRLSTASIESAMISRETSEYRIPGVPIEIPSENADRVEDHALAATPHSRLAAASAARPLMCMLHGVTMLQVEAIPICGRLKSSSSKPTARSIARLGACASPSTTTRE